MFVRQLHRSNGCHQCRRRDSRLLLRRSRRGKRNAYCFLSDGLDATASGPSDAVDSTGGTMTRIYVLYDGDCGLCSSVRDWAHQQAQLIPMVFVAANSPQGSVLFPSLSRPGQRPEELIVVDDQGGVYREGHAWIMCLYALAEYREMSLRLASPALLPLARKAFSFFSKLRGAASELLGLTSDRQIAEWIQQEHWIGCAPVTERRDAARPPIAGATELR